MPKEYVESCFARPEDVPPPDGPEPPAFRVRVGWGANDWVQIATVNEEAPLGSPESGLFVDLDRTGINNLIRLLRKARDRAYGRDE